MAGRPWALGKINSIMNSDNYLFQTKTWLGQAR